MINEADIERVIDVVESTGLSEQLIGTLRAEFADYHFTYCMDDDMDAYEPAVERPGFNIYFVNSSDHCSTLTKDPQGASGFVLAEVIDDD